jgi:hypothetical protein
MGTISGGRQQDVQGKLQSTTEKTTAAEAEFCRWRHCLDSLHKAIAEAKAKHDLLEKDSRGKDTVGLSLQEDLQRIFADTEQLRSEHDEAVTTCDEVQKRVRAIEPALEASRRRVRILEDSIEDATAETTRAKQSKETLMRELGQSRDKMRSLRRRQERLSERSQSFEKRLVRHSGSLSGTAGFAAAAATVATPSPRSARQSISRIPSAASHLSEQRPAYAQARASSEDGRGNVSQSLGYVRQWIELEEARLNVRAPPTPSPEPSSVGDIQGLAGRLPVSRGNSPPRTVEALAALEAGASPTKVVALLSGPVMCSGEEVVAPLELMTTMT